MVSGYLDRPGSRNVGQNIGCFVAILTTAVVLIPVMFAVTWGCVPAHRIDESECEWWVVPISLGAITATGALVYFAVCRTIDGLVRLIRRM